MRPYESDFAGWAQDTAQAILDGRWSEIDRAALADEVESLARRDRRKIRSRLEVLFIHLLKRRYQPERESRSWNSTILYQRIEIQKLLEDSPSLGSAAEMEKSMAAAYKTARLKAADETRLPVETFPLEIPFTHAEIWEL